MIRVFLVDDHELVRRGERSPLERQRDTKVVGECGSAIERRAGSRRCGPDLAIVDVYRMARESTCVVRSDPSIAAPATRFTVVGRAERSTP